MVRTTVYIDEDVALALRQRADIEKRSQAELIREALRRYVMNRRSGTRPAIAGIGSYRSGRTDVSERAEELLREATRKSR